MTLFERIKETAKKQGISLSKLSSDAGLGEKTIYKWKVQEPKVETLQKVAKELNVSVDYLLGTVVEESNKSRIKRIETIDDLGGAFRKYAEEKEDLSPAEAKLYQQQLQSYAEWQAEVIRQARNKKTHKEQ